MKCLENQKTMVLLLVFAFILSFGMLPEAGAETTIRMWSLFGGGEAHIMTNLIEQFNEEHPDITIDEQMIEWEEYYNKFMTGLLSGEAPDVGIMHLAVLPDYASRGVLTPIEDVVPDGFTDKFLDNIVEKAHYDGHLFAVPIDTHPLVMYYNKTVLKEAGLVDANGEVLVPTTWEKLMEYAKQIKEKTGKWGVSMDSRFALGERLWIALYTQLGANFFDSQTNTLSLDLETAAKTFETLGELYKAEVALAPVTYQECEPLFINNDSGYHFNGVWAMAVYPETEGLEFGVTSIPAIGDSQPYTWGDSHSFVFPRKDDPEKLKAALTFAEWFSDHTMEWAKAGHLPVNKAVLESDAFLELPMREDYADVGKNAVLAPSVRGWAQLREEMWELGERTIMGELSPQEAADVLQERIENIIEE